MDCLHDQGRAARDGGMVTAETAVAFPAVVFMLALVLLAFGAGADQVRCVDAARVAARAASRGDSRSDVLKAARELAPEGARVDLSVGKVVRVRVSAPGRRPFAVLPALPDTGAEAAGIPEAGVGGTR